MMTRAEIIEFITPLLTARYRIPKPGEPPNDVPREVHCQDLCRYVFKHCFDRDVFAANLPSGNLLDLTRFCRDHTERALWPVINAPVHGSLVELSLAMHPHHIGVWLDIDGGGVFHAYASGVEFATLNELRATGWRRFIFHGWHEG